MKEAAVQRMAGQAGSQSESELRTLLGETGFQQLQQYAITTPIRDFVGSVAGNLYYSDNPLTVDQGEQLAQMIVSSTSKTTNSGVFLRADWNSVETQAQRIMTAPQLSTLKTMIENEALKIQMFLLANGSASGAPPSAAHGS